MADAVGKLAPSTVEGTISALAGWQRFKGVAPDSECSPEACAGAGAAEGRCGGQGDAPTAKGAVALGTVAVAGRLAPAAEKRGAGPAGREVEFTQNACWLVVGFFGMLHRRELAALTLGSVKL